MTKKLLFLVAVSGLIFANNGCTSKKADEDHHALYSVIQYIENWAVSQKLPVKTTQTPIQMLKLIQKSYPTLQPLLSELEVNYDKLVYQEVQISVRSSHYKKQFKRLIKNI